MQCKLATVDRVQARLTEICRLEGLKVDQSALMYLLSHNNNDVRACLNALQMTMIARPPSLHLTLDEIRTCITKDIRHTAFDMWRQIFSKKNLLDLPRMLLDTGELESINQGIYENFVNVGCADFEFTHTSLLLDSLALDDTIDLRIREKQQYELLPCQTLPARIANQYFNASFSEMHLPVTSVHVAKAIRECADALRALDSEAGRKPCKTSMQTALEDMWPFVFQMISPGTSEEKESLLRRAEIFKELGFSIISKTVEPAIHRVIRLPAELSLSPATISLYERLLSAPKRKSAPNLTDSKADSTPVKRKRNQTYDDPVWFQYNEGLTNAVKRRVRVYDLIRK